MSAQDFGANDWLVDEMYEQYVADPSSVDPAWVEYFKVNKPGATLNAPLASQAASSPSKPVPPVPKSQQISTQPVAPAAPVQQASVQQA